MARLSQHDGRPGRPSVYSVAAIAIVLQVYRRVAVYLGCRRLQDPRPLAFGKRQQAESTVNAGAKGVDRVLLMPRRRCRAGEVVDLVKGSIDLQWIGVVAELWPSRIHIVNPCG